MPDDGAANRTVAAGVERFHVVPLGDGLSALMRGEPDPEKPGDPKRDRTSGGIPIVAGDACAVEFWEAVQRAGFRWIERGFARFWVRVP